jgi:hypothetical protein
VPPAAGITRRVGRLPDSTPSCDWCTNMRRPLEPIKWPPFPPEATIGSWSDLLDRYKELRERHWIFRGEGSSEFAPRPSLERVFDDYNIRESKRRRGLEKKLLGDFRRKLHIYQPDDLPARDQKLEWLALMRHHGGPTRLLDWSYSFFVATFFALERMKCDSSAAVWALDYGWFRQALPKRLKSIMHGADRHDETLVAALTKQPRCLVYPVNPFRLNRRLVIQQGVFLWPGDVATTFSHNLLNSCGHSITKLRKHLKWFELPWSRRRECLLELLRMNVSRATLFPDLDGFGAQLRNSWWVLDPRVNLERP